MWNTKHKYEGDWKRNRKEGHGKYNFEDGKFYEGAFVNDQREGHGTLRWSVPSSTFRPDGKVYVGQWKAGKMHGLGRLIEPGGRVTAGQWNEGVHQKAAPETASNPITPAHGNHSQISKRASGVALEVKPNTPADQ